MKLNPAVAKFGLLVSGIGWLLVGACGDGARSFGGDPGNGSGGSGVASGGTGGQIVGGSGGLIGNGGEIGSGGVTASGGRGGSGLGGRGAGGRIGSGGAATGTGGMSSSGSGGRTGSGGIGGATGTGSGGMPSGSGGFGTGGRLATGGAPGTGGTSGMGSGGIGGGGVSGSGGATSTVCDDLIVLYDKEMTNAKTCTPNTRAACAVQVKSTLGCPTSCVTFVDDATRLNEIEAKYSATNCARRICPKILCLAVTGATCTPSTSQPMTGTCTDTAGIVTTQ